MQVQDSIFTVLLFLGYLLLWYLKRQEILKCDGIDVNVIFRATRPIQKYFGVLEKLMTILIVLIIILQSFFFNKYSFTTEIGFIKSDLFDYIGFIVGFLGLVICRIAQVTIGKSWRVGIDENAKPGLITSGIYKFVRNPTYTGLYLMCFGVWLIHPTYVYSHWIMAFFIMMEFQVRCEEEYLIEKYKDEYKKYCTTTKRYIPLIY